MANANATAKYKISHSVWGFHAMLKDYFSCMKLQPAYCVCGGVPLGCVDGTDMRGRRRCISI